MTWKKIIKHCNKCNEPFWVGQNIAWKAKYCIPCRKENQREWTKAWHVKHPEKNLESFKRYYKHNKQKIIKKNMEYKRNHPDRQKKYRAKATFFLVDGIVKRCIVQATGIPQHLITAALVREQRELMFLNRHIRQIRKELDYE